MTVRMGFPMGVPNGNPMGMRNKTPTWEWEWDGVLVNVDGYGNDSYSHGKNSHGFFYYGRKFVQHCAIPSYPTAQVYRQLGCTNVKSGHFRLIERLAGRPAGTSRMTYGDAVRSAATTRSARRVVCRAPNPVKSKGAGRVARRVVRRAAWVAAKAGDWGPLDVVSTGRSSFAGRCLVTCRRAVA